MLASDEHAKNLFARLFSYAPRSEEKLEDYCTEGLAWCISSSSGFAKGFLKLIRKELGKSIGPKLQSYSGRLNASTQVSYTRYDAPEVDPKSGAPRGGRFDLVLEPDNREEFLIVIESKTGFGRNVGAQAREYRAKLESHPKFKKIAQKERYVITLTRSCYPPDSAIPHLSWSEVHSLLKECVSEPMLRKFAEFLTAKHLGHIDLMPLKQKQISEFCQIAPFFDQAKDIFGRFQFDDKVRQVFKKRHTDNPFIYADPDGTAWYLISGQNGAREAGFHFTAEGMTLYVCNAVPGNLKGKKPKVIAELKRAYPAEFKTKRDGEKTWLIFERRIEDQSANQMLEWFVETISHLVKVFGIR